MSDKASFFSPLDYLVIAAVGGVVGVYFLVFRKKKTEDAPAFKKLTVGYASRIMYNIVKYNYH